MVHGHTHRPVSCFVYRQIDPRALDSVHVQAEAAAGDEYGDVHRDHYIIPACHTTRKKKALRTCLKQA